MLWVIFTILLGIAFWVGVGLFFLNPQGNEKRFAGLVVMGSAFLVELVLSFALSVHTVGQRQVGIVYNFSGTITGKVDPGVVWTAPWQHIQRENVGIQSELFSLDPNNAAVSSDQQAIYATLALNYQVEPSKVVKLYKTVGPHWKLILLDSRVLQDFKEVTSGFSAQKITTSRALLRSETKSRLTQELSRYDIRVVDFFVKNLDYTDTYKEAINAKNVQVQQALQAEAKVAQATAEAQQAVAKAKGDAEAIRLKGRALHDNPDVLTLEAIDKLNPNAQLVICTGTGTRNCPSFLPSVKTP